MQDYLKKYMDPPTKKKDNSKVVYRSSVAVVDNDDIDIAMGRLVDRDQDDNEQQPIFVETNESRKIDYKAKQLVIQNLLRNKQNNKSKSRSRSLSKEKKEQKESESESYSESESGDSDSDLSLQRQAQPGPTIYRDNVGRQITLQDKVKEEEDKNKERRIEQGKTVISQKAVDENYRQINTWSKGLVQVKERVDKQQEQRDMIDKDEIRERDLYYIGQEKFDDPMRNLIKEDELVQLQASQVIKKFVKKCKFPTMPNRFGIEAGNRWDGADRSNGYEKKYISTINERQENKTRESLDHLKQL